jgi:hypothetical protein
MSLLKARILSASPDGIDLDTITRQLKEVGFSYIYCATTIDDVLESTSTRYFDLIFIDETWEGDDLKIFTTLDNTRGNCSSIKYIILSEDPTIEKYYLGAVSNFHDYLIKGQRLHVGKEAIKILTTKSDTSAVHWNPSKISDLGFFRTLGLTRREMEILIEYMWDFSRQIDLSKRLNKSHPQLRKVFSNIYTKLSQILAIDNPAQLASLLTIGAFYRCHVDFNMI